MTGERLQKVLAQSGVASRRTIESWIKSGRIRVNGKQAELGVRVTPQCKIKIDDRPVALKAVKPSVLLYHKPEGEVCTRAPEPGQNPIFKNLPKPETGRWLSVGRLDINTSGLLILTNDGEMLQKLQHPKFGHEREYRVRAFGDLTPNVLEQLKSSLKLEDGEAQFIKFNHDSSKGHNHWFTVVLGEGRNRLVRRMFEAVGLEVNRLIRIRFGKTTLPSNLRTGQCRATTL